MIRTIRGIAVKTGVSQKILQYHIDSGHIKMSGEGIDDSIVDKIINQKETLVGELEFRTNLRMNRYNGSISKHRDAYRIFLQDADYFGVDRYEPEDVLFSPPDKEEFYIVKSELPLILDKSQSFFEDFGMTPAEQAELLLSKARCNHSSELIRKYLKQSGYYDELPITSTVMDFISATAPIVDMETMKEIEVAEIISSVKSRKGRDMTADFFNWIRETCNVSYSKVQLKTRDYNSLEAYTYDELLDIAFALFGKENVDSLTKKSLDYHLRAEQWLFLSMHFICGWRAKDMCNNWPYPHLKEENPYGLNLSSLKSDILDNKISDETYCKVVENAMTSIALSNNYAHKTHDTSTGKLTLAINDDLKAHFGKLSLIGEALMLESGDGYMQACRIPYYCNRYEVRKLIEPSKIAFLEHDNILTKRLNKSYLQGIEDEARRSGSTPLEAHLVASYARNHKNANSTIHYLCDHQLTGENADIVLYLMLKRGVLGMYLYNTLVTAYPESFARLTMKEQTEIMEQIPVSAYELENMSMATLAGDRLKILMNIGEESESLQILREMYAIGKGLGPGKDKGVFCRRRALGKSCDRRGSSSCIAIACPNHVLTTVGIPSLIAVINDYIDKAKENPKYDAVLRKIIIPAFQGVINQLMKDMSSEEKRGMQQLIEGGLNG